MAGAPSSSRVKARGRRDLPELAEHVHAEPPGPGHRVGEVDIAGGVEPLAVRGGHDPHERVEQHRSRDGVLVARHRHEVSVVPVERRRVGGEVDVGGPHRRGRAEHPLQHPLGRVCGDTAP